MSAGQSGIGHWALGIEHWALGTGTGHWALGIGGHWALGIGHRVCESVSGGLLRRLTLSVLRLSSPRSEPCMLGGVLGSGPTSLTRCSCGALLAALIFFRGAGCVEAKGSSSCCSPP